MNCPKCGGHLLGNEAYCPNCGHSMSVNTTEKTEPSTSQVQQKLSTCPCCQENSLFYNEIDKIWECLNKNCGVKGQSIDKLEKEIKHHPECTCPLCVPTSTNESNQNAVTGKHKLSNISAYMRLYFSRPKLLRNAIPFFILIAIAIGGLTYGIVERVTRPDYVYVEDAVVVGATGNPIVLENNRQAKNPTYAELMLFLKNDHTDKILYKDGLYMCADFSETLHNNAEKAGIRAGYVCIEFYDKTLGHAINVFETTDRGIVYIDDVGTESGDINADKTVVLKIGNSYQPESIFPTYGYESTWSNMGKVKEIWIQW